MADNNTFGLSIGLPVVVVATPVHDSQQNKHQQEFHNNFPINAPIAPVLEASVAVLVHSQENLTRDFLSKLNWPVGLQDTFVRNSPMVGHRFFICDDSGSMSTPDGHMMQNLLGGDKR